MNALNTAPVAGTRDFSPQQVWRRRYIFARLQQVFERFGYQPIETPAMERLEVLTGKYGEEGDRLIFKLLNSGQFASSLSPEQRLAPEAELTPLISEKALRYDLTVPFARYAVQHRQELNLPFRRYQMQPVWRADRPQKGRYREFWQCDVDVVGTDSLLCEAEFVQMYDQAMAALGIKGAVLLLNHRGLLQALAEHLGQPQRYTELCVALDKLDKIGAPAVLAELEARGFDAQATHQLLPVVQLPPGPPAQRLAMLEALLGHTPSGPQAFQQLHSLLHLLQHLPAPHLQLQLEPSLARGLNYYTGCIFELTVPGSGLGSIGGGGRYDNLAGIFGWEGLSGVGISFGADRIYDLMQARELFPESLEHTTRVLIVNFGGTLQDAALALLHRLRQAGIAVELYPDAGRKMAKQLAYADKKGIPFALLLGEAELQAGTCTLKDLRSGSQQSLLPADAEALLLAPR